MINQISVFLENSYGKLAGVCELLSGNGINIRAITLAESQDFGIVRIIADDHKKASAILAKEGYIFSVKDVVAVELDDNPGSLTSVLKVLTDAQINMDYMYAFTAPAKGSASLIIKTADENAMVEELKKNGIRILDQEDLM